MSPPDSQSYVLNFHGRVTQASVKNFQIIHDSDRESASQQTYTHAYTHLTSLFFLASPYHSNCLLTLPFVFQLCRHLQRITSSCSSAAPLRATSPWITSTPCLRSRYGHKMFLCFSSALIITLLFHSFIHSLIHSFILSLFISLYHSSSFFFFFL